MLNSVSASAVYGIADPLQWHANQQKVSNQIRTNDFEQLNVGSVAGSTGPSDDPEIKSNLDKSAPTTAEQYWLDAIAARRTRVDGSPEAVKKSTPVPAGQYWLEVITARRTRIDGSLEAVKQGKINPDRGVALYRQVTELLNPPSVPRDIANQVKAISVHA
jgi:hypothetical protein